MSARVTFDDEHDVSIHLPQGLFPKAEGTMGTDLERLARVYLAEKVKRGDVKRASLKMPRAALASLARSFGHRPISQLGEAAIVRWLETTAHKSPATRRNELGAVRGFCGWLVKKRHLRINPCDDIPKIRQPRRVVHTVPRPDMETLWAQVVEPRDRLILTLMFTLGLRCVDVSNLDWEDWDRSNALLIVKGKGGHERVLPVTAWVDVALKGWMLAERRRSGPMFPTWAGRLKPSTISGRVSKLMTDAGIKAHAWDGRSAHALRRTAATETLERSGDLRATQNLLGHADLSSMRHYIARASVAEIAKAVESRWETG